MKKCINRALCALFTLILFISLVPGAYALGAEAANMPTTPVTVAQELPAVYIDTDNAASGYITVHYNEEFTARVKAYVRNGSGSYFYTISKSTVNLPLQFGDGDYIITLYKNVEGSKYKKITSAEITVEGLRDEDVYTNSISMADYEGYQDVVDGINELLADAKSSEEKVRIIHNYIINNFSYSTEKAEAVRSTDYLPDLRDFVETGEGICYDFASLFAAVLRSNGIPTKLVMGYRTGMKAYHAWNEVLLNGEWIIVDLTVDAALTRAGKSVVMAQDSSLYRKTREF